MQLCSASICACASLIVVQPMVYACRLRDEIEIQSPAHRHRILYTSAEMLSDSRMARQALATASAHAAQAWGPVTVLCVAAPLVAMCGAFLMAAVALSVPEVRHKLMVLFAVAASEVRIPAMSPVTFAVIPGLIMLNYIIQCISASMMHVVLH